MVSFCAAVRSLWIDAGGICRAGLSAKIRCTTRLASGSPGTIGVPLRRGLTASSRRSSRMPTIRELSSGPWHRKHVPDMIGRTSRLNRTRAASEPAAAGACPAATTQAVDAARIRAAPASTRSVGILIYRTPAGRTGIVLAPALMLDADFSRTPPDEQYRKLGISRRRPSRGWKSRLSSGHSDAMLHPRRRRLAVQATALVTAAVLGGWPAARAAELQPPLGGLSRHLLVGPGRRPDWYRLRRRPGRVRIPLARYRKRTRPVRRVSFHPGHRRREGFLAQNRGNRRLRHADKVRSWSASPPAKSSASMGWRCKRAGCPHNRSPGWTRWLRTPAAPSGSWRKAVLTGSAMADGPRSRSTHPGFAL